MSWGVSQHQDRKRTSSLGLYNLPPKNKPEATVNHGIGLAWGRCNRSILDIYSGTRTTSGDSYHPPYFCSGVLGLVFGEGRWHHRDNTRTLSTHSEKHPLCASLCGAHTLWWPELSCIYTDVGRRLEYRHEICAAASSCVQHWRQRRSMWCWTAAQWAASHLKGWRASSWPPRHPWQGKKTQGAFLKVYLNINILFSAFCVYNK